ncbi:MAG: ribosomal L7Ae/L30e/S12e/Gadd45 family protein [Erysipelotrichaceae bacterium]|nr:ribosomal L7Ae/L30e/S12e/Gadd45 family protein [Erysipelotrichaceae bacterium]
MPNSTGSSTDRTLNLLGLAYRAHKTVLGEQVLKRIRSVKLLILASDISEKSRERYLKKCHYYQIDSMDDFSSVELSQALGKENVKVIGIIDEGFRKTILEK